jgi:hypothetical protein
LVEYEFIFFLSSLSCELLPDVSLALELPHGIFGAIVKEQQPSMRDKKNRKKYMGEPRAGLLVIFTTVIR